MSGKKKSNSNNTPRRKRWTRDVRLQKAKQFVETYTGKNLVKGYAKWFGVDLNCALTELQLAGITISGAEKKKVKQAIETKTQLKKIKKEKQREKEERLMYEDSDEYFAFIIGYTEGGAPYGITHEEWEEIEKMEHDQLIKPKEKRNSPFLIENDELPF